jgi:hypothetical protein
MTDLSSLDIENLRGKISSEDFERMKKHQPQTLHAAVRSGVKQAAITQIFH